MKTSLYFVEDFVDVWFDNAQKVLVLKWFNLTTRVHIRKAVEIHLDALQRYQTRAIILDFKVASGMYYPAETEYFIQTLFPATRSRGICVCFYILPKNLIARHSILNFLKLGRKFNFVFEEALSIEAALKRFEKNVGYYEANDE